jgi:hypothetical protein
MVSESDLCVCLLLRTCNLLWWWFFTKSLSFVISLWSFTTLYQYCNIAISVGAISPGGTNNLQVIEVKPTVSCSSRLYELAELLSVFLIKPVSLNHCRWFTKPITVVARSKAWTVFARSNSEIVGSNPTGGMDVCMCLFYVCVVVCVGSGLETGWSPV